MKGEVDKKIMKLGTKEKGGSRRVARGGGKNRLYVKYAQISTDILSQDPHTPLTTPPLPSK